jgi:hypothetical protein
VIHYIGVHFRQNLDGQTYVSDPVNQWALNAYNSAIVARHHPMTPEIPAYSPNHHF